MKTAGVVFDFYDDPDGRVLRTSYPTLEELPDFVKEAHILRPEERVALRDDAFAIVMKNEGELLRKYACVDKGNTFLSALYFAESMDYLPEEAQKVAAAHLQKACERYELDIPFLKEAVEAVDNEKDREPERAGKSVEQPKRKRASGMSRVRDSMRQPIVGEDADWAARTNLVSVRGGNDSGRVVPTANQMKTASAADHHMRRRFLESAAGATFGNVVGGSRKAGVIGAAAAPVVGEALERLSKHSSSNFVDVSGKEPTLHFEKQASENVALGRYPLDSYADIREAVKYFEDHWTDLEPNERHEFCKLAAPRAVAIGLDVPDMMLRYGSTVYAPDVDAHLANRRAYCHEAYRDIYDSMKEKRAHIPPEDFADLLSRADVKAGLNWYWGGHIADPWFATFGGGSDKEKVAYSWEGRGEEVTEEALVNLASNKDLLSGTFEKSVVDAFSKDPVTIFESLPDEHKVLLARMANGG